MTTPIELDESHPMDEVFVLHTRPLRKGAVLENTSRFRDNKWRLEAASLQKQF